MNGKLYLCLVVASCSWAETAMDKQLASSLRQQNSLAAMLSSVTLQRASVRAQFHLPSQTEESFFVVSDSAVAMPAFSERTCEAIPVFTARGLVENAARKAGIDPNLLQAVAAQESAFRPCAVSAKGAQGLMQLMPATALELGVRNPFDPAESLAGGAELLKQLLSRYSGNLNLVLGAYNAGPARVDAAGGVPSIPETIGFVQKILGNLP